MDQADSTGGAAAKAVGDVAALSITAGAMMDWLPAIAAALSILWTIIRIYETRTVQRLLCRVDKSESKDD